jgi:hypothetical protein
VRAWRRSSVACLLLRSPNDNQYAHPIDMVPVVDLNLRKVVHVDRWVLMRQGTWACWGQAGVPAMVCWHALAMKLHAVCCPRQSIELHVLPISSPGQQPPLR